MSSKMTMADLKQRFEDPCVTVESISGMYLVAGIGKNAKGAVVYVGNDGITISDVSPGSTRAMFEFTRTNIRSWRDMQDAMVNMGPAS